MNSNALGYLLRTKMHNQLISFFKKPVRLIYFVIFIALFAFTVIGGEEGAGEADRKLRDMSELTAGINALLILIFTTTFNSGLNNGGVFFKMADVNFIFPSPLGRRNVLFYALVQQMGNSLLIGLFILFQYSILHGTYNMSVWGFLFIFLVYSLTAFLSQTLAMFLYTYVSDSEKKKKAAKAVAYAMIVLLLAYVGLSVLHNKNEIAKELATAGNGIFVTVFPFVGWLGASAGDILTGKYLQAFLWFALTGAAFVGILIAMSR